jgi:hypothetical protein
VQQCVRQCGIECGVVRQCAAVWQFTAVCGSAHGSVWQCSLRIYILVYLNNDINNTNVSTTTCTLLPLNSRLCRKQMLRVLLLLLVIMSSCVLCACTINNSSAEDDMMR